MTISKARSINGLDYKVSETKGGIYVAAYDQDGVVVADVIYRNQKDAVALVVEAVYRKWAQEKMQESNWKCERCGCVRGLQVHHKVYRSKGRDDRKMNMEVLCFYCHGDIHS